MTHAGLAGELAREQTAVIRCENFVFQTRGLGLVLQMLEQHQRDGHVAHVVEAHDHHGARLRELGDVIKTQSDRALMTQVAAQL